MEQEGRVELARRKEDSASHRMRKGRRVGLKRQNQETGGIWQNRETMGKKRRVVGEREIAKVAMAPYHVGKTGST
jgi:hypothetical protein